MTIKPESAAFLRSIREVMVDQKHFVDGVTLTGLSASWRPVDLTIDAAFSDACALLSQAISAFDQDDNLSQVQWSALQQLCMAKALVSAGYRSLFRMALVECEPEEDHDR